MLVAVRHVERRRIITEAECRRAWLPNRPAARVRTDAPWCDRHTPCRCDRRSNAFDWLRGCWPHARTREAWYPQASGQAAGAAHAADVASRRFGSAMGVPAGRDGAPFRRRHSSRRPSAGRSLLSSAPPTRVAATRGSCRPSIRIRSSCCASGSPLLLFHRNPTSRPAGGAPGKGARAPGRTLARRACRQAPSSAVVQWRRDSRCRAMGRRLNLRR